MPTTNADTTHWNILTDRAARWFDRQAMKYRLSANVEGREAAIADAALIRKVAQAIDSGRGADLLRLIRDY